MHSDFEEFNLLVYYSLVNLLLDLAIWCLGPLADDSRDYGTFRIYLAILTRRIFGIWLAAQEEIGDRV